MTETAFQLDEEVQRELDAYYEQVVTEDDQPVDNLFSAKQQTLLKRPLYASWTPPAGKRQTPGQKRPFLADADIGVFFAIGEPPIVPDFFLSLDVQPRADWHEKKNRSYFVWEFGKVPEVVVEIVSNREGGELDRKLDAYAQMGALYYVVYDPQLKLKGDALRVFVLRDGEYQELERPYLSRVGLGLKLWDGVFEDKEDTWLRWCDAQGNIIPTGEERARMEAEARQQAEERAGHEAVARQEAENRAAQLAAKLRELGVDPDQL
ncbi:MAG: Uma2 family endonuclease [Blastocatellia bacterium]